jgi:hypothetical protein
MPVDGVEQADIATSPTMAQKQAAAVVEPWRVI